MSENVSPKTTTTQLLPKRLRSEHSALFLHFGCCRSTIPHAGGRVGLVDDGGSAEPLHGLVLRGPSHDQVGERPRREAGADCLRQLLRWPDVHVRISCCTGGKASAVLYGNAVHTVGVCQLLRWPDLHVRISYCKGGESEGCLRIPCGTIDNTRSKASISVDCPAMVCTDWWEVTNICSISFGTRAQV